MSVLAHDHRPLEVLIADDHDLFALGLEETLAHCPDMLVVGRAADGAQAVALASELRPDIVLMDVNMPRVDGIVATREISDTLERTRVVMLSAHNDLQRRAARVRPAQPLISPRAVRSTRWSRSCARSRTGLQMVLNCSNGCRQWRQ